MNGSNRQVFIKLLSVKDRTGFTLIELLVTIIILGVLSAIALPSYLNQAVKARSSEAKATLSQINRAQQAYRFEKGSFASSLLNLDTHISPHYFDYAVSNTSTNFVAATATPRTNDSVGGDLPAYAAASSQASDQSFKVIICATPTQSVTPPTIITTASCPLGSNEIP